MLRFLLQKEYQITAGYNSIMDGVFLSSSPYKKIHKELNSPDAKVIDLRLLGSGEKEKVEQGFYTPESSQLSSPNKEIISDRYIPLRFSFQGQAHSIL